MGDTRKRRDRRALFYRLMDDPAAAEMADVEREMQALADRLLALRAAHPARCRCDLCRYLAGSVSGFPTCWDAVTAAAASLHVFANEVGAARPLTRAENDEVMAGIRRDREQAEGESAET